MAVVYTKSAAITALDTAGAALPNPRLSRSDLKTAIGMVTVANGDSIASIFRVARVPSSARIVQILLRTTAITSAAGDIGVYRETGVASGVVVDVDLFASAQSLAAAINIWTDVTNESTTVTPVLSEAPLWQLGGLTSDPGGMFDIAVTLTAAATAGGSFALAVTYAE
jgi:hypothetical protein